MRLYLNVFLQCIFIFSLCLSAASFTLQSDRDQPINISADNLKYDGNSGTTIYQGNVKLKQGSIKLNASGVTVRTREDGKLVSITATGKQAYFEQKPKPDKDTIQGYANKIIYTTADNKIQLLGEAKLQQGNQLKMESDQLEYLIDQEQLQANKGNNKSSSRVNIVIPPSKTFKSNKE